MNSSIFFETQRDRMVRRGDWTRAAELNLLEPEAWTRPLRVLITRLSTYEDTCLSITHHYLYALIAALGYYPDRAFLPPARDEPLWKEHGIPWLTGIQSRRSANDFGLVAISNAVVQEMGNLLWFLTNSGFPLSARDRRDSEQWPLVILGGANAPFSAMLWGADSPVDGVFVGEDRLGMEALFHAVAGGRASGKSKQTILDDLAEIPGFVVPGRVVPQFLRPSRTTLAPELLASMPVALGEGNAGKAHLAISAGCAGFCSFCAESWTRKPYVEVPALVLAEAALAVKAGQGASHLELFSFNFNMHAELYPFFEAVTPWFSALGLKSQRFDSLAVDPLLLELEKLFGKTWFTCGLEGISARLRRMLNKNLDADQLRRAFGVFARSGVRELKTFLIATGEEQEEDFEEFSRLLGSLRNLPGPSGRPLKIVFSVTPLVRFPHTPLEFGSPPEPHALDKTARRILRVAKEHGFDGRLAASTVEAASCDLMVRPPAAEFYEAWARTVLDGEFVYRDEMPEWFFRHWKSRLDALGWGREKLSVAYSFEANRVAPWAAVNPGIRRSFLEAQAGRNQASLELVPTGLVRSHAVDQTTVRRWTTSWKARKESEIPRVFAVFLTNRAVAAGRNQTGAALAQALMLESIELAQGYRRYLGSWWAAQTGAADYCAVEGKDWLTLSFLPPAATLLESWTPEDPIWQRINARFAPFGNVFPSASNAPQNPCSLIIEALSPWRIDGQRLLTDRGLKHTLRREAPGKWVFDFPGSSLKKDWVRSLESLEQTSGHWVHRLVPGTKWDWKTFLDVGFVYPPEGGASQVRLTAVEGSLPLRSV